MAFRKITLSILACTFILTTLEAKQFWFEKMTPEQTLFGERITQIIKSTDGYIWICGIDGASRFDGYNTLNFIGQDSLMSGKIYGHRMLSLHEDANQDIWIGTEKGLNIYHYTEQTYKYYNTKELPKARVIYISSYNDSLTIISSSNQSFLLHNTTKEVINKSLPYTIKSKTIDLQGKVWWGSKEGYVITNDSVKFEVKGSIQDLHFTNSGHLYIASSNGLYIATKNELSKTKPSLEHYYIGRHSTSISHKELSSMAYYNKHLWIGSRSGLNQVVFNKEGLPQKIIKHYNQTNNPHSISNNQITELLTDNDGILWVATFNGLNLLDPSKQWFSSMQYQPKQEQSIHDNNIICIDGDTKGNIWISGFNSGITRYNLNDKSFVHFHKGNSNLHADHIRQMTAMKNGDLYFYNNRGISYYKANTQKFSQPQIIDSNQNPLLNLTIHNIFQASTNQIWLGTNKALYKASIANNNTIYLDYFCELPNVNDIQICEDPNERIWLSTDKGLILIHPKNPKRTRIYNSETNPEFINTNITDITFDTYNNLWICTVNGLYFLSKEELLNTIPRQYLFNRYDVHDGLPSNHTVAALADINGRMWISTWNGITRFDPFGDDGHFTNFDSSDGLISQKYTRRAAFKDTSTNNFYFGGVNGVNYISPSDINPNIDNQTLSFHSIQANDDEISIEKTFQVIQTDTLIINQKRKVERWEVMFHFNSMLSHHHQNFKWRYLDSDSLWHFTTRPSLSLNDLSNGSYLLEMMPVLPNGESGKSKIVQLNVNAPNYILISAITLIVLIVLGWIIFQYIKAKNKKPKYRYSNLSQDESTLIFQKLEQYMANDKPYLNSKLTVDELTTYLDVSNVTFSQVLNKFKNTSFYEYVNHYRVSEFKKRLSDGYNPNLTLLGLAEECGFSSKSSFYRAFKKETNLTPAQFEKKLNEK